MFYLGKKFLFILFLLPVSFVYASPSTSNSAWDGATPEEIAAAQGLEAMLIDHMIQEMRKSVPENDMVPVTQGERIFRQMLDSEYARMMSESNSIGIAELVLAQIRSQR